VRFLGRKVYAGFVVLLVSALRHGATPRRMRQLRAVLGVDRRTLVRWRCWWREAIPATPWWKLAAARLVRPVDAACLPRGLLASFMERGTDRLIAVLKFLAPLSTLSPPCDPAF